MRESEKGKLSAKQVSASLNWSAIQALAVTVLQFTQLIILARLLDPEVFGLMAMLQVLIGFSDIYVQFGLAEAIIQRQRVSKKALHSLYWINLAMGCTAFFILFASSALLAKVLNMTALATYLPVLAVVFLLSPWGKQFRILAQKQLRFKEIALIEISAGFLGMLTSICLALSGFEAWSLVIAALVSAGFSSISWLIIGIRAHGLPRFICEWGASKSYISFGAHRLGAMMSNYLNSRIDQLLIGMLLGPQALGYYNIAFKLVMEPVQKINPIATHVMFPFFSKIQDDTIALRKAYLLLLRMLTMVNAPILIGLAVTAEDLIPMLLGTQWVAAVPIIQILALYSLLRSLGNAGGGMIMAKGRADWTFYWNFGLLFIISPAIYFAAIFGTLVAICWTLVILQIILIFFYYLFFIRTLVEASLYSYLIAFCKPLVIALIMGLTVKWFGEVVTPMPEKIKLITQILYGVLFYALFVIIFLKEEVLYIKSHIKNSV